MANKTTNIVETVLRARNDMGAPLKAATSGTMSLQKGLLLAGAAVTALGVAATLAGKALVQMTKEQAKLGDEAAKGSKRLGLLVEDFTAFQFAADRSGASSKAITTAMRRLAMAALEARDGVATYKDVFDELGITVTKRNGDLKELKELFLETVQALKETTNQTARLALGQQVLGRGMTDLAVFIDEGRTGIMGLMDEAERYGAVIGPEFAKNAEEFIDSQTNMAAASNHLKRTIVGDMMPKLTAAVNEMAAAMNDPKFLEGLRELGKLAGQTTTVVFAVGKGVLRVMDWWGRLRGERQGVIDEGNLVAAGRYMRRQGTDYIEDNRGIFGGGAFGMFGGRARALPGITAPAGARDFTQPGFSTGPAGMGLDSGGALAGHDLRGRAPEATAAEEWKKALEGVKEQMDEIGVSAESIAETTEERLAMNFADSMAWAFASIVDGHDAMIQNLKAAWKNLIREILHELIKTGLIKFALSFLPGGGLLSTAGGAATGTLTDMFGHLGSRANPIGPAPGLLDDGRGGAITVNITAMGGAGAGKAAAAQFIASARAQGVL